MPKMMKSRNELQMDIRELENRLVEIDYEKTKRRKVEEALLESMENFKSLADNAYDCIMIGMEDGSFGYFNKRAVKVLGYTEKELLKMTIMDITHPDEHETTMKSFQSLLTGTGYAQQLESVMVRKNGEAFPIGLTASRTKWHGESAVIAVYRDITERKKAEEALLESEDKFRTLAEESPNMIFINDLRNLVYVNKATQDIMGYSKEELISNDFNFLDMIAPEDRDKITNVFKQHLNVEDVAPYECGLLKIDGTKVEVMINTKLIKYEGGSGILGIITDITARKRDEEILKEKEMQLRLVLNAIPDAIYVVDRDLKILMLNHAFLKWNAELGLDTEPTNKDLFEVFPFLSKKVIEEYKKAFEEKRPVYGMSDVVVDDKPLTVETTRIPILNEGKVDQVITIVRNVTDRKNYEEKISESEEQFRILSDQNIMGIVILQEGNIVYANNAVAELSEFQLDEILMWGAEKYSNFVHPEDREFVMNQTMKRQKGLEPDTTTSYTCRIVTKNGIAKKVEIYAKSITYKGKPADFVIINDLSRIEKLDAKNDQ